MAAVPAHLREVAEMNARLNAMAARVTARYTRPMDALTLAQQIVDVVRQSPLDRGRRTIAMRIATDILLDLGLTHTDESGVYADERPGGISARSTST